MGGWQKVEGAVENGQGKEMGKSRRTGGNASRRSRGKRSVEAGRGGGGVTEFRG